MKKYISSNDYEKYEIEVPFFLCGKKLNKFIRYQLDMLHPCFSEEHLFECRKKIVKKKCVAEVFVLKKEVEQKYRLKNGRVFLEHQKGWFSFSSNFMEHRKLMSLSTMFLVFALVGLLAGVYKVSEKLLDKKVQAIEKEKKMSTEIYVSADEVVDSKESFVEQFCLFLKSVSAEKGLVNSISFTENDFEVAVSNCYPERLYLGNGKNNECDVNVSSITYCENIPSFSVRFHLDEVYGGLHEFSCQSPVECMSEIRSKIILEGGNLLNEDWNMFSISSQVQMEKFNETFDSIAKIVNENNCGVEECTMCFEKESVNIFLKLKGTKNNGSVLEEISNNKNLLISDKKNSKVMPSVNEKQITERTDGVLIGKVLSTKGVQVSFYKSADGKITGVAE